VLVQGLLAAWAEPQSDPYYHQVEEELQIVDSEEGGSPTWSQSCAAVATMHLLSPNEHEDTRRNVMTEKR